MKCPPCFGTPSPCAPPGSDCPGQPPLGSPPTGSHLLAQEMCLSCVLYSSCVVCMVLCLGSLTGCLWTWLEIDGLLANLELLFSLCVGTVALCPPW